MKEVYFNPDGGLIKTCIKYTGLMAAAYGLKLSKTGSNEAVFYKDGDNLNPEDDIYELPSPAADNDGRIIRLSNEFYGLDISNSPDFSINFEIYQDNELLNFTTESGQLTGNTQSSLMFIKFIAQ
ncbi:MAG: hypothetical protein KAU83_05155 [Bacteroidales bacterium]|nr:hypothetical protein [Bacteroidales bacterium]